MDTFNVESVRLERILDSVMVMFDVVTPIGRVELSEYVNVDEDGDFKSVEFTDSNIRCHLTDELCSVFDLSGKPGLMPKLDYVPFADVLNKVTDVLVTNRMVKAGYDV